MFEGLGSRAPGMPGNRALEELIAERFSKTEFPNGAVAFQTPVFRPGSATATLADGTEFHLETMHPTLMRPGNFTDRDFTAPLVYLGRGSYDDLERLKGTPLAGTIAVMDYACGGSWMRFLRFGIRGFIFVGAPDYAYYDSVTKVYNTEVSVPRFFVPPE